MGFSEIIKSNSKTFAALLAMFCFGVLMGPFAVSLNHQVILVLLAICLVLIAVPKNKKNRIIALALFLFIFGIFRFTQSEVPNIPTLRDQVGSTLRVSGTIDREVESKMSTQRVILKNVTVADDYVFGNLLVHMPLHPKVSYNDKLVFSCSIKAPEQFNNFAYDKFLETKGVLAICYYPNYVDVIEDETFSFFGTILSVKEKTDKQLRNILPAPHGIFLSGLLFGGSSGLSKELQEDFSRTGTSHILAASGFNVALFSFVFLSWIIGSPLGRRRGIYLTAALLCIYVVMAGMGPAVIRATILAFVILIGALVGRKASTMNALLFAGSLILLANPRLLLYDVGFQLSFVATAAIIFLVPKWRPRLSFIPESFGLRDSITGSLAAIVATLPIIIYHFGAVSLIAPIVNLLVLPFVPYIIALLVFALVVSIVSLKLATLAALPAWALSSILLHIITFSSRIPFASVALEHNRAIGLTLAGIFIILFYWIYGKARHFHLSPLI